MKMKHWTAFLLCSLAAVLLIYPGCVTFKANPAASSTASVSPEPLTGNWAMTRVSIEPPLPAMIPGFVVDQIFPKTSAWAIGTSGGQLTIKYNGKAIWFNSLGINVAPKPVSASEAPDKKSCTFSGGGNIQEDKLPGVFSMISAAAGNPQNISIGYTDKVAVTLTSSGQMNAVITYSASGTYKDSNGPENFNYGGTLTYTGTRK